MEIMESEKMHNFFLLPFNQSLGVFYLIFGEVLLSKHLAVKLYILYIYTSFHMISPIRINFVISTFGNFLRNVQLK